MIDEDLRTYLLTDATIAATADEVAVGQVPIADDGTPLVDTYIWYGQFDEFDWIDLDAVTGMTQFKFNLECVSSSIVKAKTLAQRCKRVLQGFGYQQPMGYATVDAVFVEAKSDDYVPVNRFQETNITVAALSVRLYGPSNLNLLGIPTGRIGIDWIVG